MLEPFSRMQRLRGAAARERNQERKRNIFLELSRLEADELWTGLHDRIIYMENLRDSIRSDMSAQTIVTVETRIVSLKRMLARLEKERTNIDTRDAIIIQLVSAVEACRDDLSLVADEVQEPFQNDDQRAWKQEATEAIEMATAALRTVDLWEDSRDVPPEDPLHYGEDEEMEMEELEELEGAERTENLKSDNDNDPDDADQDDVGDLDDLAGPTGQDLAAAEADEA